MLGNLKKFDSNELASCGTLQNSNDTEEKLLSPVNEVARQMSLTPDDVQHLIDTQQLLTIRIRGKVLIPQRDVISLIETYRRTALRHVSEMQRNITKL